MRVLAAVLVTMMAALAGSANAAVEVPQVTVIGDSVLTAVEWNAEPLAVLQNGLQLRLDIGVCRRLTGESCLFEGERVPTLLDVVHNLGPQIGRVVLVEVGYNDDHDTFAANVELSIQALLQAGVQHILWANLHGFTRQWLDMNAVLAAAAQRHPELTVIDWNHYGKDNWSWFQRDSIHLEHDGAMAMAKLFRTAIDMALDPVVIAPAPLPLALVGKPYAAHLLAQGGDLPYSWRVVGSALPKGLHLRPNGSIDGVPKRPARVRIVVRVVDGRGIPATSRKLLEIDSGH